jgi:hypothetical protein
MDAGEFFGKSGSVPYFLTSLPGGLSEWEPPDPIPNSEVKLLSADDSVGFPHVKVGHCQAFNRKPRCRRMPGFLVSSVVPHSWWK